MSADVARRPEMFRDFQRFTMAYRGVEGCIPGLASDLVHISAGVKIVCSHVPKSRRVLVASVLV